MRTLIEGHALIDHLDQVYYVGKGNKTARADSHWKTYFKRLSGSSSPSAGSSTRRR
jgi:hypothetical protein